MRAIAWMVPVAMMVGGAAIAQDLDAERLTQPDDVELYQGDPDELLARGEELYADESLGTSGLACTTCHADFGRYKESFAEPYPHPVDMAQSRAGMAEVNAAEMVQLCMVVPMATEPLPWDSPELAALVAYVEDEQERFAAQQ